MDDRNFHFKIDKDCARAILAGVNSSHRISELSHNFYRYPARFSPLLAREIIRAFSRPGDTVLDPFMGGGTTLVEACALGRIAVGSDISSLATFLARVKTLTLNANDVRVLEKWFAGLPNAMNIHYKLYDKPAHDSKALQGNLNMINTWRIKKLIEQALATTNGIKANYLKDFARCVVLSSAQWALDCRKKLPSVEEFRFHVANTFIKMIKGAKEFAFAVRQSNHYQNLRTKYMANCFRRAAADLGSINLLLTNKPTLILTSPPYPGIHVLYHRWQILSRRETPAPFWIANCVDGTGASYYTFGDRKQRELVSYYDNLYRSYSAIAKIAMNDTLLVQVVGFSNSDWQLPRYLEVIESTGFKEIRCSSLANSPDKRLWRHIPNRKWYTKGDEINDSGQEVILFHKKF